MMITCSTVFSGGFLNVYDKFAGDIADTDWPSFFDVVLQDCRQRKIQMLQTAQKIGVFNKDMNPATYPAASMLDKYSNKYRGNQA